MSEEQQPSSAFETGTTRHDVESSVMRFLQELPSRKRLLGSPVPEPQRLSVARRRAEFAQSLLASDQFGDAIQLMNERVMQELYDTPMHETERLGELSVRLRCITDFVSELETMVGYYQSLAEIDEQERRAELYGDTQTDPTENVI